MALPKVVSAATSRLLPLRMRADLEIVARQSDRVVCWAIKDAVAGRYWGLEAEEAFILRTLDGHASSDEICDRFAREFAPRRLTPHELTGFLGRLHLEGLLVVDQPGQADEILDRQRRWRRTAPLRACGRLLAMRFRGIDPDRWLESITPRCRLFFTPWSAALFGLALLSAVILVVLHWPALDRELATLAGSFTSDDLVIVMIAICLAKALHELGHAIACKHFGGECHELGLMLFVGAPSLYCNVSDAWMLPDKLPRVMISAAGIAVELALASLCAWLWWFIPAGAIHSLALYMMGMCSVNTLFLNGNPLLQYDGYYVLGDLTETPNLRSQAAAAVRRVLARALLGLHIEPDNWRGGRRSGWLVLYGIASAMYRCVVMVAVVWILHETLRRYDLQFVSWIVAGLMLMALLAEPTSRLVQFVRRPSWDGDVPWRWTAPRAALLGVIAIAALTVPLPCHIVAPVMLEPRGARSVYVDVEGRLVWAIDYGASVNKGDVIARLDNLPLATELARLTGERDARRQRVASLLRRQAESDAAAQLPTAEKSLADSEERLRQRQRDFERLVIVAPRSGVVLPPPWRKQETHTPAWIGSPLDQTNRSCHLQTGDLLCVIGEPRTMDAIFFVAQGSEDLIQAGQPTDVFVDGFPGRQVLGTVTAPAAARSSDVPDELLRRGILAAENDGFGRLKPKETVYAARAALEQLDEPLLIATTGRAKVKVASRSIAGRVWRSLGQAFLGP